MKTFFTQTEINIQDANLATSNDLSVQSLSKIQIKKNKRLKTKRNIIAFFSLFIFILLLAFTFYKFVYKAGNTIQEINENNLVAKQAATKSVESLKLNSHLKLQENQDPITGEFLTKELYEKLKDQRIVSAVIDNATMARPQAGLSEADVVYEVPVEDKITRYLGIFWQHQPKEIGPIRSTRVYILDVSQEYDPVHFHIGQATSNDLKSKNKVDAFDYMNLQAIKHTECSSYIDQGRITQGIPKENSMFFTLSTMRECIPASWNTSSQLESWSFKENLKLEDRNITSEANINLTGDSKYSSRWIYNREKNIYLRYINGSPDIDKNNQQQVTAKNIILQYVNYKNINDELKHLSFDIIGKGKATYLLDGKIFDGTWQKDNASGRTKFLNTDQKFINFNRGNFWIIIVPVEESGKTEARISLI